MNRFPDEQIVTLDEKNLGVQIFNRINHSTAKMNKQVVFLLLHNQSTSLTIALNIDGVLLLSFKYSILSDPLSNLENWSYQDETPCSWRGVTCNTETRVTSLSLPNSNLLGSIPADLPTLEFLQFLDLSNNSLNGSLPFSIFDAGLLRFLDLSNNFFSGELPATVGRLGNVQSLNLSDNALAGNLPENLQTLQNLTDVSLKSNYISGNLSGGFDFVRVLDLSSNLINGSLPFDFGGNKIRYLNISYNKLSGSIPDGFVTEIPINATIDLSFNSLTGEIPKATVFTNQKQSSFAGNNDLCGELTKNPCQIPSSPSTLQAPTSPPAIAVKPTETGFSPSSMASSQQTGLKPKTIVIIVVGDFLAVIFIGLIFFYVYKKRKNVEKTAMNAVKDGGDWSTSSSESKGFTRWSCLRKRTDEENKDDESETSISSDSFENQRPEIDHQQIDKKGTLVIVNGELELETLLKASAYILGATGSSIMYKAVLEDGNSVAVRRIGETSVDRFRDFENQVRVVSKLVHPNLVRIRGFYWGVDEKLVIYDFVPNGSLANARHRKLGSSPCHLPWEARLRIAKGVARGLAYLHDKKHVHGNLKPNNILLGQEMEPQIGDFGLEKLITCDTSYKVSGGSTQNFGSNRSVTSQDFSFGPSLSPSPSTIGTPYHAPESLRSLKPNPKWDVYSFGVILLELLTGKVVIVDELGQGNGISVEDGNRALRMSDVAIRADVEGKEEALLSIFKLGYSCASPIAQKRPSMKEALHVLDKFPTSSTSTSYVHGH